MQRSVIESVRRVVGALTIMVSAAGFAACGSDSPTADGATTAGNLSTTSGPSNTSTTNSTDGATTSAPAPSTTNAPPPTAAPKPATSSTQPAAVSPLPSLQVRDVSNGATVQLTGVVPAGTPLLVWFWAPH